MDQYISELLKEMKLLIPHKLYFDKGIGKLLEIRRLLYTKALELLDKNRSDLDLMPFINSPGYESKNVIYSIYHIFRIEDIVLNILILEEPLDIFLANDYKSKLNSSIITTGNELEKEEIKDFTKNIDAFELLKYIEEVYSKTNNYLTSLKKEDLKTKISDKARSRLIELKVVDEKASFLIDYWCKKDIFGLIKMPFSRHWFMHIEAASRIMNRITGMRKFDKSVLDIYKGTSKN